MQKVRNRFRAFFDSVYLFDVKLMRKTVCNGSHSCIIFIFDTEV